MKYIFLTQQFYIDYKKCTEIEQKQNRPYVQIHLNIKGIDFAIPLRSHIKHKDYVLWTDKKNQCGLDFTKAIVIEDVKYIDTTLTPYIRPIEHSALIGKDYDIEQGMISYIEAYKNAKMKLHINRNQLLCQFSTMQYFEKFIIEKTISKNTEEWYIVNKINVFPVKNNS